MPLSDRKYPAPDITERPSDSSRETRSAAPPRALLQISRDEGVDVDVPWLPSVEADSTAFDRATAPAPFWVESLHGDRASRLTAPAAPVGQAQQLVEPEPRQTTPSIVRFSQDVRNGRKRWVAAVFAAAMIGGGVLIARAFAADVVVAQ